VGSVLVVVVDVVANDAVELLLVPDDGAVKQLSSDRSDPALGERVGYRRSHGCLEDLEAFGAEHLVKRVDELAAAVTNECPCVFEAFGVADEQVPGGVGGPRSGRVRCDTGEDHLAAADVDEEQDVVAAQEFGVNGEEVAGDGGLGVQELGPGDIGAVRGTGRCRCR